MLHGVQLPVKLSMALKEKAIAVRHKVPLFQCEIRGSRATGGEDTNEASGSWVNVNAHACEFAAAESLLGTVNQEQSCKTQSFTNRVKSLPALSVKKSVYLPQ